jgi:two-component system, NtrC family, nitrogen regulation sensor histidine kinase GlnL
LARALPSHRPPAKRSKLTKTPPSNAVSVAAETPSAHAPVDDGTARLINPVGRAETQAASPLAAFDWLAFPVLLLDGDCRITYSNIPCQALFAASNHLLIGMPIERLFADATTLLAMLHWAMDGSDTGPRSQDLELDFSEGPGRPDGFTATWTVTLAQPEARPARLIIDIRPIDTQRKIDREERLIDQSEANRILIRNLAHEIRNPLGGIRGAAQLLEHELPNAGLREYTQVIVKESDRLQQLMDRLLTPSNLPRIAPVNIHEVLERVRSVMRAEFRWLKVERDYDASLPELHGDKEQLIQVVLNIVRNAAQALEPEARESGMVTLRTRIARQVMIARDHHRLALELLIMDNGPGVPDSIRDRIFDPLVSGREGGSGIGLMLAQTYVRAHRGIIEMESRPGMTQFKILLPLG